MLPTSTPFSVHQFDLSWAMYPLKLFIGPPGTGKTLLASSLPSILPPLSSDEWLEVAKISSAGGNRHLLESYERPFRSPHHSITPVGLIGGGNNPVPGELTLAHRGVLFLDEICEFPRHVLELLRQPLEERVIHLHRNRTSVTFPASFILVASMNPCPCGYFGFESDTHQCRCTSGAVERYRKKLSGPLLDRFDIQLEIPRMNPDDWIHPRSKEEPSEAVRARVFAANTIQQRRFQHSPKRYNNSDMKPAEIKQHCKLEPQALRMLRNTYDKFQLSHRSFHRILKLARTIADLDNREHILEQDIAEAIYYRSSEKKFF
jgi:magnesium chelatase family protein